MFQTDTVLTATGDAIIAELEQVLIAGAEMNMLKTLALVDSAINIPTPLGAALALKLTAVAAVQAKGTAKLSGIASLAELASGTVPMAPITAAIDMAPRYLHVWAVQGSLKLTILMRLG